MRRLVTHPKNVLNNVTFFSSNAENICILETILYSFWIKILLWGTLVVMFK